MTRLTEKVIINLPFAGFYETIYSSEIDTAQDQDAEHLAEQEESKQPPELRLSKEEISELFFKFTDYRVAYRHVAREYVEAFSAVAKSDADLRLDLQYESMDSPREYNFKTDRVYAHISWGTVLRLFALSKRDNHAKLAATIRERFTSYDGFHSFYDNSLQTWLDKPLAEWDHNELCTLLIAVLPSDFADDSDLSIYYLTVEGETGYNALQEAVDWPAFEKACEELREEKAAEARAQDPDFVAAPPRCSETIDMFTGRSEER